MVTILVKLPDYDSRIRIHHFLNEELAKSASIYDRKLFIVFCSRICPRISKKYFKEVFAFSYLKLVDERKKDIAIAFATYVLEVRKKIDDHTSTSKIESTLTGLKSVFHKDNFIQKVCSEAYNSITTAQFKSALKSNLEMQNQPSVLASDELRP